MNFLIKQCLNKFIKNDFIKGASILASGTVISQVIPFLIAPIISRLYLPTDYALLASYSAITTVITILATGMYDSALMLDKKDEDAINTASIALFITSGVTFITLLSILFLKSLNLSQVNDIGNWIYIIPITVFFQGGYQTLNFWNNRKSRYNRLANNKIITSTLTSVITISLGYYHFHEKGLLVSLIVGQITSFLILFIQTYKQDKHLISHVSKIQLIHSLKTHKDFPIYNLPQGFLDSIKESSLVWIISFYFGTTALGSFSFAKSILMRPLQIISGAVSQVFYQRASKQYFETGDILSISKKTFLTLFFIGFPFALIMYFFGKNIFVLIFGNEWELAGYFSEILIFWLFITFISSPLGSIPIILKKQKTFFKWSIFYNVMPLIMLYFISKKYLVLKFSIIGFSITNILIMTMILIWIKNIISQTQKLIISNND